MRLPSRLPHYEATLGERVYLVEQDPDARKLGSPDVAVLGPDDGTRSISVRASGLATLDPVTVPLPILEGPAETYIEILHQPDQSLVAALELLSPTNKSYPGRTQYLEKRMALLFQQVHLIELDLLRGGHRMPTSRPLPPGDYYYLLARAEQRPDGQVYSCSRKRGQHPIEHSVTAFNLGRCLGLGEIGIAAESVGRSACLIARPCATTSSKAGSSFMEPMTRSSQS